ncbi:hypothetical protein FRB98_008280 [Tulasnella sp. 332]|nr:hypothetical protein FRB98_008280 [Tulasnella sp. 332]
MARVEPSTKKGPVSPLDEMQRKMDTLSLRHVAHLGGQHLTPGRYLHCGMKPKLRLDTDLALPRSQQAGTRLYRPGPLGLRTSPRLQVARVPLPDQWRISRSSTTSRTSVQDATRGTTFDPSYNTASTGAQETPETTAVLSSGTKDATDTDETCDIPAQTPPTDDDQYHLKANERIQTPVTADPEHVFLFSTTIALLVAAANGDITPVNGPNIIVVPTFRQTYQVIEELASTPSSRIFKVQDRTTLEILACKVIDGTTPPDLAHGSEQGLKNQIARLEAAERELDIWRSVDHPHIVQLIRWYKEDSYIFMVMTLATSDLVPLCNKSMTPARAQKITTQVIDPLIYLHDEGITHKDIKPDNILVFDKAIPEVLVPDSGIAEYALTNQSKAGSYYFIALEVITCRGGEFHNSRVDVWFSKVCCFYPPERDDPTLATVVQLENRKRLRVNWPAIIDDAPTEGEAAIGPVRLYTQIDALLTPRYCSGGLVEEDVGCEPSSKVDRSSIADANTIAPFDTEHENLSGSKAGVKDNAFKAQAPTQQAVCSIADATPMSDRRTKRKGDHETFGTSKPYATKVSRRTIEKARKMKTKVSAESKVVRESAAITPRTEPTRAVKLK